jgi:hypothetical protein
MAGPLAGFATARHRQGMPSGGVCLGSWATASGASGQLHIAYVGHCAGRSRGQLMPPAYPTMDWSGGYADDGLGGEHADTDDRASRRG